MPTVAQVLNLLFQCSKGLSVEELRSGSLQLAVSAYLSSKGFQSLHIVPTIVSGNLQKFRDDVSVYHCHCSVTSGHLVQDGIYESQSENKVKHIFWFDFVLNRASGNFAIYYKTHCDDRSKSEVDTKEGCIKIIMLIIEHI